jgi:hypothetical protein
MTAFELNPSVLHVFLMDISGLNIQVLKILDKDNEGEEHSHSLRRLKLWTLMESDEEGGGFT